MSEPTEPGAPGAPGAPALRIVRGDPTPEELAVVTAVVAASAGGDDDASAAVTRRGRWNDPSRQHRQSLLPGPNAWRAGSR